MDEVAFGILKAFYATLVSIDRNEACVRSWTDPEKMALAYGARRPQSSGGKVAASKERGGRAITSALFIVHLHCSEE